MLPRTNILLWNSILLILLSNYQREIKANPVGGLLNYAATAITGPESIRRTTYWSFDPDKALRDRQEYVAINGWRGNKLLERLGQGFTY